MNLEDVLDLTPPQPPVKVKKQDKFFDTLFNYVNSITLSKENLMVTEEDEKLYDRMRFQLHRALSFYPDLVGTVNILNQRSMPARMEYEFLLNFVIARPRRNKKWIKKAAASMYLETVQEYYGYSETKAEQALKTLTVEQLEDIEKKLRKKEDVWTYSGAMA